MILAYHLIISAYGFWLPNDPRGSWSDFVRSYELYRAAGPATKTDTRRSVAGVVHDRSLRERGKATLRHPPVRFTGEQALALAVGVGVGVRKAIEERAYRVLAAAVLPDHAHFVVARHDRPIEAIQEHFKSRATRELNARSLNPLAGETGRPSPWARKGWHVFLDDSTAVGRAVAYVEANPEKAGLPRQRWSWVVGYDGAGQPGRQALDGGARGRGVSVKR